MVLLDEDCPESLRRHFQEQLEPRLRINVNTGVPDIGLIRSDYLLSLNPDSGDRILPRQLLPPNAFTSFEELKDSHGDEHWIYNHIIVISHMWQTPNHPDPYGNTLRIVQQKLKKNKNIIDFDNVYGMFWDYMSLYQGIDPRETQGKVRRKVETRL